MSTQTSETATTYGWDTVFAMHIADVNRAIVSAGASPAGFDVTDPDPRDGGLSATGQFGAWQIVTGGDSHLVKLDIPVNNVIIKGLPGGDHTVASAVLKVGVHLNFLRDAEADDSDGLHHLKVRTTIGGGVEKVADVTDVIFLDPTTPYAMKVPLLVLADLWLNAHLGDFDHIFATIDLNSKADKDEFQWLQPTAHEYSYSDLGTDGEDGALAILCMTQKRSADGLEPELSSVAILPGQRAGFLISKERMMQQMLLPAMPRMFPGTSDSDFKLSDTGDSILNAHDNVAFTATDSDGKTHKAKVISLSLRIEGGELQMDVQTRTDLSEGIRAHCHTQNFLAIALVNKSDGTQTLGFSDARPAQVENWTEQDEGFSIAKEVLLVAGLVALAVSAVATAGTTLAAAAIIMGVVAGVAAAAISITETAIEMAGRNDAPSINSMLLNATAPIVWADSGDFLLTSAQLNDCLQLSGTLVATK